MKTTVVKIRATLTSVCVKNKEHLLLGGAYGASTIWHHNMILTIAYGVVAIGGIHVFRWLDRLKLKNRNHAVYHGRHLAD